LIGALDGRTFPNEQRAATAGFRKLTTIEVENAGHNLFMLSPEITETISDFMRGDASAPAKIVVEAPSFAPQR
jgi:hypothetical protein